jgi:ribosomal protein S19
MARSLKKGPFVAHKLMKKIEALHAKGEKSVIQHGPVDLLLHQL